MKTSLDIHTANEGDLDELSALYDDLNDYLQYGSIVYEAGYCV